MAADLDIVNKAGSWYSYRELAVLGRVVKLPNNLLDQQKYKSRNRNLGPIIRLVKHLRLMKNSSGFRWTFQKENRSVWSWSIPAPFC